MAGTMGAKTDLFPTFAELCASAREVEKKPLSIPPRPIDGKLVLDENFGIFPREFDDYTYSYLLFEAQKIERQLGVEATVFAAQPPQQAQSRSLSPEQQMESDLRRFVSAQEQAMPSGDEGIPGQDAVEKEEAHQQIAGATRPAIPGREAPGRNEGEAVAAPDGNAAASDEELPSPPPVARQRVLPPKTPLPSEKKAAPQIPQARASPSMPASAPVSVEKPSRQGAQKSPEPPPYVQRAAPTTPPMLAPEGAPSLTRGEGAGKKQPAGISSYSKLSPRLQSLIEAKLRREEEKAKRSKEDSDIFKPPPPPPHEEEPPEPEAEGSDAPNAWNLHDDETESQGSAPEGKEGLKAPAPKDEKGRKRARDQPVRTGEEEAAPAQPDEEGLPLPPESEEEPAPEEDEQLRQLEPAFQKARGKKNAAAPKGEAAPVPAPEEATAPSSEEEMPALPQESGEEKQAGPSSGSEERHVSVEEMKASALRARNNGPVMIKPIFPDDAPKDGDGEEGGSPKQEDTDRMRRIQRILEDLSPGKARAPTQRKEEALAEKGGEDEGLAMTIGKREDGSEDEGQGQESDAAEKGGEGEKPAKQIQPRAKLPAALAKPSKQSSKSSKKKPMEAKAEAQPEEEAIAAPAMAGRKLVPSAPLRPEAAESGEGEEAPAPRKIPSRIQASSEEESKSAQAPRKLVPRMMPREEKESTGETVEEEAQLRAPRKLVPRMMPREEDENEEGQTREEEPAPAKLKPRIPPREEETESDEAAPERAAPLRRRILPGMARTAPTLQRTYVPPARGRKLPAPAQPAEEHELEETQGEPAAESNEAQDDSSEEKGEGQGQEASSRMAYLKPRKLVSDEPSGQEGKTPGQAAQDEKMAKMAAQLARLEAGRVKEVAGTAQVPQEEEDIPLPPQEEAAPAPQDYEQAKENLRKSLEHEETARRVAHEDEAIVEQYAKDHLVWLYEIYKMGGMGRADFISKASEKYSEAQGAAKPSGEAPAGDAPANPALANLSKEIEKKDKK